MSDWRERLKANASDTAAFIGEFGSEVFGRHTQQRAQSLSAAILGASTAVASGADLTTAAGLGAGAFAAVAVAHVGERQVAERLFGSATVADYAQAHSKAHEALDFRKGDAPEVEYFQSQEQEQRHQSAVRAMFEAFEDDPDARHKLVELMRDNAGIREIVATTYDSLGENDSMRDSATLGMLIHGKPTPGQAMDPDDDIDDDLEPSSGGPGLS